MQLRHLHNFISPTVTINGKLCGRGEVMRLDKYLKTARILKRRTVSKELADNQRVFVNGKIAKPSTEVKNREILLRSYLVIVNLLFVY